MRILLVNPPAWHQMTPPKEVKIIFDQHELAPPIGLMYLKSFIQANGFPDISIFNFQTPECPTLEDFAVRLREFAPDLVGISVMGVFWYDALEVARLTRQTLPGVRVVVGGPSTSIYPREMVSHPEIDFIVIGEGEYTLLELLRRLEGGESLEGTAGLCWKRGDEVLLGPPRPLVTELDALPFPDRSDFNPGSHRLSVDNLAPAAVVMTSRGCPQDCSFCLNTDRRYRVRSAARVVDEVEQCLAAGYRSIDFYDDNFNQSRRHVVEICEELQRRGIKVPWSCRCRVDRMDDELLELMASVGCVRVQFGVESGSDRLLKEIKKGITVAQSREAFRLARKHGISTLGYFIIGFPGETLEEMKATVRLIFELAPDYMILFPLMPLPGTEIYRQALKDPKFGDDLFRSLVLNPQPDLALRIWPTAVPGEQILSLVRRSTLRFYLRPRFILSVLRRLGGIEDFLTKARMGLKLLGSI